MGLNHNDKIQAYINQVCSQVRFRDVHQDIRLELETHINEAIEEYLSQGSSEEEAIKKAIAQMGDPETIGKELNQVHKPKPDWIVLLLSFLFINIGLLAMYIIQKQGLLPPIQIFNRSLFFSFVGVVTIIGLYFFDYRKLEKYSKHIYLGTLLLLIYTILFGRQVSGSRAWLNIGPFSINFVANSPLLFIVAFAGLFNNWNWSKSFKLLQGLALLGMPLLLYLAAPSISTGVIYIVACMVLMFISGAKFKEIASIPVSFLTILTLAVLMEPYRLERLKNFFIFLNPENDPLGIGYLNVQLHKIITNSGLWGQGLTFKPRVLPELHTDFIFAFITYTFGWVGSILLITFVIIFLIRIASIARQVKLTYAKLLISGVIAILSIQFLWNILMNLGLAPLSSVGLPFISYGGSQLFTNAITVGIILSIYRRRNISQSCKLS
ncbi:MAG: FtsW/RodA/SpoVE family cell cycle protein [Zhaonellaceae bacterium]|jgi:rod shape determining protein RodA